MIHRCFIYVRWNFSCHFVSCEWRTLILAFRCIIWTRLANVRIWVKFRSRNSEVFKIYTKHLSFLVYNQVYNLFFVPCVLVWLHFCDKTETNHCEIPARSTSPVRVKGGMSLRNGMWHGLWNDIIMRNLIYPDHFQRNKLNWKERPFLAPINLQTQPLF